MAGRDLRARCGSRAERGSGYCFPCNATLAPHPAALALSPDTSGLERGARSVATREREHSADATTGSRVCLEAEARATLAATPSPVADRALRKPGYSPESLIATVRTVPPFASNRRTS